MKVILSQKRFKKRGQVDVRKTMRHSLKTYGELSQLIQRRRKRRPLRWVVIADVSGSVKHAVRLFMSFLFELQSVFEDLRAFAFVSTIQEVTPFLRIPDYQTMVTKVFRDGGIDFRGYSDYGRAFEEFENNHASCLDSQTLVVVIGDARNNRRNPRADLLAKWGERVRKVIWLNPEDPEKWDQGDSIISLYAQSIHCTQDISTPDKLINCFLKSDTSW